jgi:hypothetical protein
VFAPTTLRIHRGRIVGKRSPGELLKTERLWGVATKRLVSGLSLRVFPAEVVGQAEAGIRCFAQAYNALEASRIAGELQRFQSLPGVTGGGQDVRGCFE